MEHGTMLQPGIRLGRYEVLGRVGVGGMGEVYRAHDSRLDRTVALKTIGSSFAHDPTAAPRFERERMLTAALEHPHVCRLLDADHEDGISYLAMEYLSGETLAARVARGPIPASEAVEYAIEITDALAYAHERRVIHRDLKPSNVFLTRAGVKVLDFGLATLCRPGTTAATAQEETERLNHTSPGTLIGSALYMAPERLEGAEADERSDIFSFGMVLYEMLAGQPPFHATTAAGVIAAIIAREAPPFAETLAIDAELDWLVRRCLMKLPADRWQSMRDINAVLKRHARRGAVPANHDPRRPHLAIATALMTVAAAGVVGWPRVLPSNAPAAPTVAFRVEPPPRGAFTPTANSVQAPMLALSPDGAALAFVGSGADGTSQIWLRRFDSVTPRALPGTTDAMFPFWSPDSRSVAFFSRGLLKRVDLAGGPPRTLAAAPDACGGAWSPSGVILFAPQVHGGLMHVSAQGGPVTEQTRPDEARGETSHRWPRFIGDGSRFVYFARSTEARDEGIYLATLAKGDARLLVSTSRAGEVGPPNRLLFLSDGTLLARSLDVESGRLQGETVVIADRVGGSSNFYPAFSASATGVVAFAGGASTSELLWFDRSGQHISTAAREAGYVDFRISPDNKYVAVAEIDPRTDHPDLYLLDIARATRERLTSARVTEATPTWSPDSRELLFRSNRGTVHDVYRRDVFNTAPESLFLKSAAAKYPTSWFRRRVLFHTLADDGQWDVWVTAADGSAAPRPLLQSRFIEAQAQFSPDGEWIAYAAEETPSRFEVYVQHARMAGRRWRISVFGGSDPHWNPGAPELFYVAADGWLTSVAVAATGEPGRAARLFRMPDIPLVAPYLSAYDVARDGRHFLVRVPVEDVRTRPVTVLMNRELGVMPEPTRP
jgi:Tol biopolymer transport system component